MRQRVRRRIDWDEELNKTERIRRRGLFVSMLGFGVALAFIFGAKSLTPGGVDISRKVLFTFCLMIGLFLVRLMFRCRERLSREREEREEREATQELRRWRQEKGIDKWPM